MLICFSTLIFGCSNFVQVLGIEKFDQANSIPNDYLKKLYEMVTTKTYNQIGLGANKEEVISCYGKPTYETEHSKKEYLYFFSDSSCLLFVFNNQKLVVFTYFGDYFKDISKLQLKELWGSPNKSVGLRNYNILFYSDRTSKGQNYGFTFDGRELYGIGFGEIATSKISCFKIGWDLQKALRKYNSKVRK